MNVRMLSSALAAVVVMAGQLAGQPASAPVYHQTLVYVKAAPGKGTDYIQFVRDTSMKMAQVRADAGEIISWTILRSVYPAGEEARSDYLISTIYEGVPRAPQSRSDLEASLKKANLSMKADDFLAKRNSLSTLVATEMWRPRIRVAAPAKGHFLHLNMMKVNDAAAYQQFEETIWRPMAEEWVKRGEMSGWVFATKVLPAGTDTAYTAYSADMFPSWNAAFAARSAQAIFEKVHPGKSYQEFSANIPKLRSLARRELWEVVERVEKKK
jgi:hypothetical protein